MEGYTQSGRNTPVEERCKRARPHGKEAVTAQPRARARLNFEVRPAQQNDRLDEAEDEKMNTASLMRMWWISMLFWTRSDNANRRRQVLPSCRAETIPDSMFAHTMLLHSVLFWSVGEGVSLAEDAECFRKWFGEDLQVEEAVTQTVASMIKKGELAYTDIVHQTPLIDLGTLRRVELLSEVIMKQRKECKSAEIAVASCYAFDLECMSLLTQSMQRRTAEIIDGIMVLSYVSECIKMNEAFCSMQEYFSVLRTTNHFYVWEARNDQAREDIEAIRIALCHMIQGAKMHNKNTLRNSWEVMLMSYLCCVMMAYSESSGKALSEEETDCIEWLQCNGNECLVQSNVGYDMVFCTSVVSEHAAMQKKSKIKYLLLKFKDSQ